MLHTEDSFIWWHEIFISTIKTKIKRIKGFLVTIYFVCSLENFTVVLGDNANKCVNVISKRKCNAWKNTRLCCVYKFLL